MHILVFNRKNIISHYFSLSLINKAFETKYFSCSLSYYLSAAYEFNLSSNFSKKGAFTLVKIYLFKFLSALGVLWQVFCLLMTFIYTLSAVYQQISRYQIVSVMISDYNVTRRQLSSIKLMIQSTILRKVRHPYMYW